MARMSDINIKISAVLANRRKLLPDIDYEVQRWERISNSVRGLGDAVAAIRSVQAEAPTAARFADLDVAKLDHQLAEVLAALAAVRARVSRQTVNIGVSGRARNGKSTLLQSLSGLGDEQIPAGPGQPVTAVRSRILHSVDRREAVLTLHSERSFSAEVLAGYHEELQLGPLPRSADEFGRFKYPRNSEELAVDPSRRVELTPMLVRLLEMQASIDSYREFLNGRTQRVDLEDLRRWVAYPNPSAAKPDRRYLAVRDAQIVCRFPIDDVQDIGLCDLPGLGEVSPRTEEHHLAGLENDVDFVLVVKRPADANATWFNYDARGLSLITRAAGAAPARDFVAIVVNTGGCTEVNIDALVADIDTRVNEGTGRAAYWRILADAADPDAVKNDVLVPVLNHLADALPRMDQAVFDHALGLCAALRGQLLTMTGTTLTALRSVLTTTALEQLLGRADKLRAEVAASLQSWVAGLEARAEKDYEDVEYFARVEQLQTETRAWVVDGFGEGVDAWCERALKQMRVHDGSLSFAGSALSEIRIELTRRFRALDELLGRRREEFWAGLTTALGPRLVHGSDEIDARQALEDFADALRESSEPCPTLASSIDFVLDVRLDYRTRMLPQMRLPLTRLRAELAGDEGRTAALLSVPRTPDGARTLYTVVSHLARQAVHDAGMILAEGPGTTASVLLAFGEQFEDSFIRSAASEAEFRRLAEAFRDELWPGTPDGSALATARVQHLRKLLRDISATLSAVAEPLERTTS
jgi:hypothetical protein